MNGWKSLCRSVAGAVAVIAGLTMTSAPASAQLFWDWDGDKKVNDTGRKVVPFTPSAKTGDIIVSFSDRRLYYVRKQGEAVSYPIAIPREIDRWQGITKVSSKRENPSWTPTPDMIRENPKLPRWVPGGHPMNPLGIRALYLGSSTYRIHGTDAPWTIGTAVSKGCIRMYNKDVLDLYPQVPVNTKVTVTWDSYEGARVRPAEVAQGKETQGKEKPGKKQRLREMERSYMPVHRASDARRATFPDNVFQQ